MAAMQSSLQVTYGTIQNVLTKIPSYYVPQGDGGYELYSVGDSLIQSVISGDDSANLSHFEANFKPICIQAASGDDALVLGMVANRVPLITPRTDDGRVRTANEKPTSIRTNFYTHDYCDKTTWYSGSIRVMDETPTDSGDHTTYTLAHNFIIDSYHGKLTGEDTLLDPEGNSYRVSVKVNGVTKTEQDPHYGVGEDYTINYESGSVTFLSPLDPSDEVKVTYHYATNSRFTVKPTPGKKLILELAEVQFSQDVNPTDSVVFELLGKVEFFYPPMYVGNSPGQIPPGTIVSLQKFVYKAISDFHNDAFKSYPSYPAMGTSGNWRSQHHPVTVFDWDYVSATALESSKGMEIVVYLDHDTPYEGYLATCTFYCKSESE